MNFLAVSDGAARAVDAQEQRWEFTIAHLFQALSTRCRVAPVMGPSTAMRAIRRRDLRRQGQIMLRICIAQILKRAVFRACHAVAATLVADGVCPSRSGERHDRHDAICSPAEAPGWWLALRLVPAGLALDALVGGDRAVLAHRQP